MEYIREIINSDKLENIFYIPENLKHRTVEVLIVPIQEKKNEIGKFRGILKEYANPDLVELEESAWEMVAREKHGNR